jgi:hypothetical protein
LGLQALKPLTNTLRSPINHFRWEEKRGGVGSVQRKMESGTVGEFIRTEVADWDDEAVATARFKAFSGQKSDWEARYEFWKFLILKIARRFGLLVIRPLDVKNNWFNRGGLTPLCLDEVLVRLPYTHFIIIYLFIYLLGHFVWRFASSSTIVFFLFL